MHLRLLKRVSDYRSGNQRVMSPLPDADGWRVDRLRTAGGEGDELSVPTSLRSQRLGLQELHVRIRQALFTETWLAGTACTYTTSIVHRDLACRNCMYVYDKHCSQRLGLQELHVRIRQALFTETWLAGTACTYTTSIVHRDLACRNCMYVYDKHCSQRLGLQELHVRIRQALFTETWLAGTACTYTTSTSYVMLDTLDTYFGRTIGSSLNR